jgi:hypothetical protein
MNTLEYVINKFGFFPRLGSTHPTIVPNFGRDQMATMFAELGFTQGVEIGVWKGEYSEILCKANPNLHLWSVDPWELTAFPSKYRGMPDTQAVYDTHYEEAKACLAPYNCTILRLYSMEAVKQFKNESLDFVYIDGNHDFQNCTNDIVEWSKKVRQGGIISGHDYTRQPQKYQIHVKQVLDAYTAAYAISPWFVLGNIATHEEGMIRDLARSWFWVRGSEHYL